MNNLLLCLFAVLLTGLASNGAAAEPADLKCGLYIHYGMDTFRHPGEKGRLPVERFAPGSVAVEGWAQAAKQAGMTFAVLTAKHESGFCLWASRGYDYDIAHSAFKGDILADFIAACKAKGILPGVHYSIPDAYNEGAVRFQGEVAPPYFSLIKQHFTELSTKYPELRVLIPDGSARLSAAQLEELGGIVKRLNPQCVVWAAAKTGDAQSRHESFTVNKGWMWSPNEKLNSAPQLFSSYLQCQLAGKAFVLNVGPTPSGVIPASQIAVLMQLKNLIANPPPTPSAAEGAAPKADAGQRLKKLKSLYDQGLITKEDYDKKAKEILDSL